MRVDVVSNLYPPTVVGGAELSTELLVRGLRARGCRVRVITLAPPGGVMPDDAVVHLPNPNPYWAYDDVPRSAGARIRWHISDLVSTKSASALGEALEDSPPDLVLTQNTTGLGLASLRAARAAASQALFVHTLRDYSLACVRATRYRSGSNCGRTCLQCRPRALATRYSGQLWDGVVGVSQAVIDVHQSLGLFRGLPTRVISNAFEPADETPSTPGRVVGSLGYLGRISEEKGIYDLLRALRRLAEGGLAVPTLLVAGEGSAADLQRFERESTGLPVRLLGWVTPSVLLSSCDWLVVPSRWQEPFGRVVLEAAANGVGLVVADTGGLPEAAKAAGRDDVIFYEPGDVAALSKHISMLGENHGTSSAVGAPVTPERVAGAYLAFAQSLGSSTSSGAHTDAE